MTATRDVFGNELHGLPRDLPAGWDPYEMAEDAGTGMFLVRYRLVGSSAFADVTPQQNDTAKARGLKGWHWHLAGGGTTGGAGLPRGDAVTAVSAMRAAERAGRRYGVHPPTAESDIN